MTLYEQFVADRRRLAEIETIMAQPLDLAVLSVRTSVRQPPTHAAALIVRTQYLRRHQADPTLALPVLEPACMDRGS